MDSKSIFLDLPLELREHIYTFCFDDTSQPGRTPPLEPSLTRVSKQIRAESLPFYYAVYTLPIQTFIRCSYHGQVWLRTEQWYHNIPPSKLKDVKYFYLNFALIDRYTGERVPIEFHIDLRKRHGGFCIRQSFTRSWFRNPHRIGDPADFEELIAVLYEHLSRTLRDLSKDSTIRGLSAQNIDRLVKVEPDSLPL